MNKKIICALVAFLFLSEVSNAQFAKDRAALRNHYDIENIRVFYDLDGQHAVDATDENENDVPDVVEDVARQTLCARYVFVDGLGFPDPLESERYERAEFLDINMLSKDKLKLNGVAYDGLQKFNRSIDPEGTRAICFDVSSKIEPNSNQTPTHEYFHLIQNCSTYFKCRWYTEGMARWSEHALDKGGLGRIEYKGRFPQTRDEQLALFEMAYDTEFYLWNPLAKLEDKKGKLDRDSIPREAQQLRYVNGKVILEDLKLNGAEFMKALLLRLGEMDDVAMEELGFKDWSEKNQKSLDNSPYIYKAIIDVATERGLKKIGEYNIPSRK